MPVPRPMTRDALKSAFAGESMAHMRYMIYADIAEKEGFKNVARLFRAIAYAEYVHASNHLKRLADVKMEQELLGGAPIGLGKTSENLEYAIMGEEFEVNEMYPIYIEIARKQGEKAAEVSFYYALEAEKIHAELFRKAKEYVDRGEDFPIDGYIWICPVCGYTVIGKEPPAKCPICGLLGKEFKKF
ncbi:MAG: rubrerythrin family protein [Desulfurococcales archaeon]|nr:rubrerythrin family protein [Desulfurococcales archaeon]